MKKTLIVNRFDKQLLYQYMYRIDLLFFFIIQAKYFYGFIYSLVFIYHLFIYLFI